MDEYVPLRVRSNYSLLVGAAPFESYLEKAARWELESLALTDESNLYAMVAFAQAAKKQGISPVFGALMEAGRLNVLIQNQTGYQNLCQLLSLRNLDSEFSLCEVVGAHQAGLLFLVSDSSLCAILVKRINKNRLWVELCRPAKSVREEQRLLCCARDFGLPVVGTSDVYFAERKEWELARMLTAIRRNCLLNEVPSNRDDCLHLLPPKEFCRLFMDLPQAVKATHELAEMCVFSPLGHEPVFPRLPGNVQGQLRYRAYQGAMMRYETLGDEVASRLDYELDVISRLGFADYFLVVEDIVAYARHLGTPVAGRGSGASSLVAYCLQITNVDPIHFHLPFERFLNEGRQDYPDLDIDLCWRKRDEVIAYVYRKYGDDHVAMISTHVCMKPRMAFRLTAKALGLSRETITEIQHILVHYPSANELVKGQGIGGLPDLPADPKIVKRALRYTHWLEGFPHHLSIHPGGVLITPNAIASHAPLERASKGVVIVQYEKEAVEEIGLIKIDLLGNRAISTLGESLEMLEKRHGRRLDAEHMPNEDQSTAELLSAADTIGINQLESPAMRQLLSQLEPNCARDLMKILALIRPGAASLGMKETFVRRARGLDKVPPIDPRLDGILQESYGVMLYEDEALQVASALAGLPAWEADAFRKAITKCRSDAQRLELSRTFLTLCSKNKVVRSIAVDLWTQMAKFNSYSFCRAHAASYGQLAWANAYMKTHYPLEFWVAALNNNQGMYEKWVYIEEAKRMGVEVRLPCVNRSADEFCCEDGALRIGLGQVRELSQPSRRSIYENRPFAGVFDFVARTRVGCCEALSLLHAGALDFAGRSRPELHLYLEQSFKAASKMRGELGLFSYDDTMVKQVELEDYSAARKFQDEWELLSMSASPHPVARFRSLLERNGYVLSDAIVVGQDVLLCGMLAASRTLNAERGGRMCFMTFSDEAGLFEAVLFPDAYDTHKKALAETGAGVFWMKGTPAEQYGAVTVSLDEIGRLDRQHLDALWMLQQKRIA